MFRSYLVCNKNTNINIDVENDWNMKIPGLVKVPFFDSDEPNVGYVVYYSEVKRVYGIIKYNVFTGEKIWENSVINGGYGTSLVWRNLVIILKGFCGIAAFDKFTGEFVWEVKCNARVRTSLNISNDSLWFASGGVINQVNYNGKILNTIKLDGAFFFGTISLKNDHIISIGTKFDENSQSSRLYIWGININGDILFETDLGTSHVISSDTSGF